MVLNHGLCVISSPIVVSIGSVSALVGSSAIPEEHLRDLLLEIRSRIPHQQAIIFIKAITRSIQSIIGNVQDGTARLAMDRISIVALQTADRAWKSYLARRQ